jgi:hypothetical protein
LECARRDADSGVGNRKPQARHSRI